MKVLKLSILVIFIICLFSSCVTVPVELVSVQREDNEIDIDRGQQYQSNDTKNLSIMIHGDDIENNEGMVSIGLLNKAERSYSFDDSQVSIYGGNIDSEQWELVTNWDAMSYFSRKQRDAKNAEFWNAFAGAMSVASASMGSLSTSTVNTGYGSATITTTTYNPADVAMTAMVANNNLNSMKAANASYLSTLQDVLLFDSRIAPSDVYAGLVFFEAKDQYPDYKIVISDGLESKNFYFSRADREEITNPWLDQSHPLHSVSYSIPLNGRNAVQYNYLHNSGIGFYCGASWYSNQSRNGYVDAHEYFLHLNQRRRNEWYFTLSFDPNPNDVEDADAYSYVYKITERRYRHVAGGLCGINFKIVPHFWMALGLEISAYSPLYTGTLEYQYDINHSRPNNYWKIYSNDFKCYDAYDLDEDFLPQIGFHYVANFIDLSAYVTYSPHFGYTYFNLGCGIAF